MTKRKRAASLDALPAHPSHFMIVAGLVVVVMAFWGAFAAAGTFSLAESTIGGVDSVSYYSWLRSSLFDGDLQFENEYRRLNPEGSFEPGSLVDPDGELTTTDHLPNAFAIGPAILWSPFVALAHLYSLASGGESDGYGQPYVIAVYLANMLSGLLGMIFTYFALTSICDRRTSAIIAAASWLCTSALYYTFGLTVMAHASSYAAVSLFAFLATRAFQKRAWQSWFLLGFAFGLCALVRWQNVILALIPLIVLIASDRKMALRPLLICYATAAFTFIPQMIAWYIVYGDPLTIPQGSGFMSWTRPQLLGTLFSPAHGLLTWTPLCAAGIAGLVLAPKEHRPLAVALGAVCLLQLYISACAGDPGWSFGARRLVNCIPLLALGTAFLVQRYSIPYRRLLIAVIPFAVWNFLFVLQYSGYLDHLYVADALLDEYGISVQGMSSLESVTLANGESLDFEAVKEEYNFPRGGAPSMKQFLGDKLTILVMLFTP